MDITINFEELAYDEAFKVDGGGILSAVAGGLAGVIIGCYVGMVPAIVTGDVSYIGKSVVTCGTVGLWAGLGCPTP